MPFRGGEPRGIVTQGRKPDRSLQTTQARPSLKGEWLARFYAERPEEFSTIYLLDELSFDSSADDKTLFTGHRGSGKTTELARLGRKAKTHPHGGAR